MKYLDKIWFGYVKFILFLSLWKLTDGSVIWTQNSMRHNLREIIYKVSRIWALTLKTGVSKVHLWQVYLRLFLGTIEDRNNHTLKVVNLDVGMKKKSGKCHGRKEGRW